MSFVNVDGTFPKLKCIVLVYFFGGKDHNQMMDYEMNPGQV